MNHHYTNSIPSYLMSANFLSGIRILPSMLNAVMNVAILPASSSVFSATITWSFVPGTNLKDEYPRTLISDPILLKRTSVKNSLHVKRRLVARCSSAVSSYFSVLARRGRKNHLWWMLLHTPDSWIMYPVTMRKLGGNS